MVQVADEKMADVSKQAYSKFQLIHGQFQDNFEKAE